MQVFELLRHKAQPHRCSAGLMGSVSPRWCRPGLSGDSSGGDGQKWSASCHDDRWGLLIGQETKEQERLVLGFFFFFIFFFSSPQWWKWEFLLLNMHTLIWLSHQQLQMRLRDVSAPILSQPRSGCPTAQPDSATSHLQSLKSWNHQTKLKRSVFNCWKHPLFWGGGEGVIY